MSLIRSTFLKPPLRSRHFLSNLFQLHRQPTFQHKLVINLIKMQPISTTPSNSNPSLASAFSPQSPTDYIFPTEKLKSLMDDETKEPLVIVACGSFSPITYLHLRMFEMARDHILDPTKQPFNTHYEILGGYFSPVSDAYGKSGLAQSLHRIGMCHLATRDSSWLMVDTWEPLQKQYVRTAKVLDHFEEQLNVRLGGVLTKSGVRKRIKIMLLAGGDLIESFSVPNLWSDRDLHHILGDFGCIIVERTGSNVSDFMLNHDILYYHRQNVLTIKQYIFNDISSTKVRLFIKRGMSIRYLLPNPVVDYIITHGLYK